MRALRPYQARAIEAARREVAPVSCGGNGRRAPLFAGPPGLGKTTLGATLASRHIAKGGRVAWFSPRIEIVSQAADALASTGAPADRWVSTTYQGAIARGEVPEATMAVFDECHCLSAAEGAEFKRVADAFAGKIVIGLTATPERGDGSALAGFDCLVPVSSYSELIELGFLVTCRVISPEKPLKSREIICPPVDAYLKHTPGDLAVCFGPTVEACHRFADEFRGLGVRAEVISATSKDRDEVMARFRAGTTRVLLNVDCVSEGFDWPAISCVILARKIGTCGRYLQTTGRALRPWHKKTTATLLDLAGTAFEHGSPIEDRVYSLDGAGIQRAGAPRVGPQCSICGGAPPCDCGGREQLEIDIKGTVADLKPWIAAMRVEPEERRVARLARWIQHCRVKAWKLGAAAHKFKAVYGAPPSREVWEQAQRLAS